ncbi:MAG: hypothetical protein ACF788_01945 [Novipirellula sp. JB048]
MKIFHPLHCPSMLLYGAVACAAVLPWSSGCDRAPEHPVGTISGSVSYEGTPVQQGIVTFYSSELGVGVSETIQPDGRYATQTPIRTGTYSVTILPPEDPPPMDEVLSDEAAPVENIPEAYRDPTNSGLQLEVTQGENTFDIKMTP